MNPFTLLGKTILITGASSGIGRSTAIHCSKMGATVIATGRNEVRLKEGLAEMNGAEHQVICADITNESEIISLVNSIVSIDGVVLCAGINDKSLFKQINQDKIDKMYHINIMAPILLLKEIFKKKKITSGASIVFISSISSFYATISNALYASSKGAINSLIRVLALEYASKKIRVNGIMPGMVRTDMINAYGLSEEQMGDVVKSYPLGRLGEPVDVANGVIYLLSDASCWVTGTNIVIDGGITLR